MKKRKPTKAQSIRITSSQDKTVKRKPPAVDKLEQSTWMKIDDRSIDRDLHLNADGSYKEVWE
jgi:hypothetical protein